MNEGLNVLKKEGHLKEGVQPIMASLGSPKDFPEGIEKYLKSQGVKVENMTDVNWFEKNQEKEYIISSVDGSNKFSKDFFMCMGLLVAGITPAGKKLSFLTHQVPNILVRLDEVAEKFNLEVQIHLQEMKKKCSPGTLDAVIVGGEIEDNITPKAEYEDSVKKLGAIVRENFGFEPVIINGPKLFGGTDEAYYDNDKRRLYFIRENPNNINFGSPDFMPSEIDKHKDRW